MSHVTPIKLEVNPDPVITQQMCDDMGWKFVKQSTYKWYGQFMGDYPLPEGFTAKDLGKCEYAVRISGANYEVGLARNPKTGEYQFLWDFWSSGGLQAKLGKNAGLLKQAYGMARAKVACKNKQFVKRFYEQPAPAGKRKLVIEV